MYLLCVQAASLRLSLLQSLSRLRLSHRARHQLGTRPGLRGEQEVMEAGRGQMSHQPEHQLLQKH